MKAAAFFVSVTTLLAACSSSAPQTTSDLLIVVNAPFSRSSALGALIAHGTELAVNQINRSGGIEVAGARYRLRVQRLDNGLSPQRALDNVREAVAQHAVAIVDEGTGLDASWRVANGAHIPIFIVYGGGMGLVDPKSRPNVFRIAPTDHGVSFRLAEYLIPKGLRVAFLHDDSDYGQQGEAAFRNAFGHNPGSITTDVTIRAGSQDPSSEVLQARRSGATALLLWGLASTLAQVVRTVRGGGWEVPIYAPPSAEDPLLRQNLSDHPEWLDGLTFASGRMTAEAGPGPFIQFRRAFEKSFGAQDVGVETAGGKEVFQPPDLAMYPYDFVGLLAAAIRASHNTRGAPLIATLNQVDVRGANGDERGFNELNHEGVVDDDIYFASFRDMTFEPVKDDALSSTLPVIQQTP